MGKNILKSFLIFFLLYPMLNISEVLFAVCSKYIQSIVTFHHYITTTLAEATIISLLDWCRETSNRLSSFQGWTSTVYSLPRVRGSCYSSVKCFTMAPHSINAA